jgi:hypothetical protein
MVIGKVVSRKELWALETRDAEAIDDAMAAG